MNRPPPCKTLYRFVVVLFILSVSLSFLHANPPEAWVRQEVSWQAGDNRKIKAILYPPEKPVLTRDRRSQKIQQQLDRLQEADPKDSLRSEPSPRQLLSLAIDSPSVDGFTPFTLLTTTNKRKGELEITADWHMSVLGTPLPADPANNYALALLDTGSSAHLLSYQDSQTLGVTGSYLTGNYVEISGASGQGVSARVTQPIGMFSDGLAAGESGGAITDFSAFVGQSNVALAVGPIGNDFVPTVIGSPLTVYCTTVIYNDQPITFTKGTQTVISPNIQLLEHDDAQIPDYPNRVPLELRPLGAVDVEYIISLESFLEFPPVSPSVIIGNLSQNLFFVSSVDLYEGDQTAYDKDRFMLDTGAQVTVIGSRIAARLQLNPAVPEFMAEIQDVTGQIISVPGFYVDAVDIPTLGQWLSYTDVPVILLDVASPEGGTLDGIIGMNLFNDFNLVLRGGGLAGGADPYLSFEPFSPLAGDIAIPRNGVVDLTDLLTLLQAWLSSPPEARYNTAADLAPDPLDQHIDLQDFNVISEHWLQSLNP